MGCAVVEAGTREANDVSALSVTRQMNVFSSAQLDVMPLGRFRLLASVFALPPQSLNPAAVVRVVTADTAVFNPNPASLTEGLLPASAYVSPTCAAHYPRAVEPTCRSISRRASRRCILHRTP